MQFTGEYRIPAPRQQVWEALNDPDILKVCIDGCESLAWAGEGTLDAVVRAKVGPVHARFAGTIVISDVQPGESYVLSGEGKGGAAGFAKGQAVVRLREEGDETLLHYEAKSSVGGKIATVGSRLISGVANKMADEFFQSFTNRLLVAMKAAEIERLDAAVPALDRHEELDLGTPPASDTETEEEREAREILRTMQTATAASSTGQRPVLPELAAGHRPTRAPGQIPVTPGLLLILAGWGLMLVVLGLLTL